LVDEAPHVRQDVEGKGIVRLLARIRRTGLAALVVLALGAAAGCVKPPAAPSSFPAFSQQDLVIGQGDGAVAGNVLTVHYTGWLYDPTKSDLKGPQFGTSRGGEPFALTIGVAAVIDGWDQGILGMKVGGIRRLVVPPALAYGSVRNGPIPPYSALVFEVEVLTIETE
jgi:FKBP-type peptidyl-prolyl cis-trans isomerase FkpA